MTIAGRLGRWYRRHARDLPWRRRQDDPYAQLVAEFMLHQTQAATVVPYYERFLRRFPTVRDLADADPSAVLDLWAGLGYYRRAHHLHAAARRIVADFDGRVPDDVDALLTLPGVGRYTAGAVASIAFDRRAPILDGNVKRVFARVHGVSAPVDEPATRQRLWTLAEELLPRRGCGVVNQALMELGATVCHRRNPQCDDCPLASLCVARAHGTIDDIPATSRRPAVRDVRMIALVARTPRRLLLRRRGDGGLWAGMWETPSADRNGAAIAMQLAKLLPPPVVPVSPTGPSATVQHRLTHRTIRFDVFTMNVRHVRVQPPYRWWPIEEPPPLPTAHRKILAACAEQV